MKTPNQRQVKLFEDRYVLCEWYKTHVVLLLFRCPEDG